jgi:hypothetical protein
LSNNLQLEKQMATAETSMPLDKLAKIYRKMRDKKQALQQECDAAVAAIDAQMAVVTTEMKDQMLAAGVTSVKTDQGTVILGKRTRYNVQDWDAFKAFVVEHNALDLFEKRVAQTNMATFLQDNPDTPVPSLQSNSEYAISVRKPTGGA